MDKEIEDKIREKIRGVLEGKYKMTCHHEQEKIPERFCGRNVKLVIENWIFVFFLRTHSHLSYIDHVVDMSTGKTIYVYASDEDTDDPLDKILLNQDEWEKLERIIMKEVT